MRPASENAMLAMLSDALYAADLRWMWSGCVDACAQFDGVREPRDAFAMLSHPKTHLSCSSAKQRTDTGPVQSEFREKEEGRSYVRACAE